MNWRRVLLSVSMAVWALLIVGACTTVLLPKLPTPGLLVSFLVTSYSLWLLVFAVAGALFGWAAWRLRWRWATAGVAVVAVLAAVGAVLPWAMSLDTANANDVNLSLPRYFSSGPRIAAPTATEVYATPDGQPLRLDVRRSPHPAPGRPAVVDVHGGAWIEGGRGDDAMLGQWLVDQGYTVFDIDYRLSPPPRWNVEASDVKCAIGWVAQHAQTYDIDPGNITVTGGSAGGNLALLAAYTTGTGAYPPSCAVPEQPVRSVISFFGPTAVGPLMHDSGAPSIAAEVETKVFGGTPAALPAEYTTMSPMTYVRAGLPPTLQLIGSRDHVVPPAQATSLGDRLAAVGVAHRTVVLPWADHGFNGVWGNWSTQIAYGVLAQFLDAHTR